MKARPAPAGAGTPVLNPADLCGCSAASSRALKRASRSAQQTASASAAIQPNRGAVCSDHRNRISAGAVPNAILSLIAIQLRAELALRPQQPRDAPVEAVEHAGEDDRAKRLLPLAANREADAGQAHAQRQRGDRVGDHRAERDSARIPVVAHWLMPVSGASTPIFAEHRLAGDRALAEQHRGAVPAGR